MIFMGYMASGWQTLDDFMNLPVKSAPLKPVEQISYNINILIRGTINNR
jgi:hypothetical protein